MHTSSSALNDLGATAGEKDVIQTNWKYRCQYWKKNCRTGTLNAEDFGSASFEVVGNRDGSMKSRLGALRTRHCNGKWQTDAGDDEEENHNHIKSTMARGRE
jgi:hypothetical protein